MEQSFLDAHDGIARDKLVVYFVRIVLHDSFVNVKKVVVFRVKTAQTLRGATVPYHRRIIAFKRNNRILSFFPNYLEILLN